MLSKLASIYGGSNIRNIGKDVYLLLPLFNGTHWVARGTAIRLGQITDKDLLTIAARVVGKSQK